jgi:hypothetical protein
VFHKLPSPDVIGYVIPVTFSGDLPHVQAIQIVVNLPNGS